jgi:hypothetical protein
VLAAAGRLRCKHSATRPPSAGFTRTSTTVDFSPSIPVHPEVATPARGLPRRASCCAQRVRVRSSTRRHVAAPSAGAPGAPGAARPRGAVGRLRCPVSGAVEPARRSRGVVLFLASLAVSRRSPAGGGGHDQREDGIPVTVWMPRSHERCAPSRHLSAVIAPPPTASTPPSLQLAAWLLQRHRPWLLDESGTAAAPCGKETAKHGGDPLFVAAARRSDGGAHQSPPDTMGLDGISFRHLPSSPWPLGA